VFARETESEGIEKDRERETLNEGLFVVGLSFFSSLKNQKSSRGKDKRSSQFTEKIFLKILNVKLKKRIVVEKKKL